jgi:hypothetical protein
MTITHECACGAVIMVSRFAAGRRARCKSCGLIFRIPVPGRESYGELGRHDEGERCYPLSENHQEAPTPTGSTATRSASGVASTARSRLPRWKRASEASFWQDAWWSFVLVRDGTNLALLVVISAIQLILTALQSIPFFGFFAWPVAMGFAVWLCAFYLHVVAETAQGDDVLSLFELSDIVEDLIRPCLRFVACGVVALGPAYLVLSFVTNSGQAVPWHVVGPLACAGVFLWPVMILAAAIGRELPVRYLPVLVKTVLMTPGAYLAVCGFTGLAGLLAYLSLPGAETLGARLLGTNGSLLLFFGVTALGQVIGTYATIVAMRQIGLYYRHFKARFPWRAE